MPRKKRIGALISTETLILFVATIAIAAIVVSILTQQQEQPPITIDSTGSFIMYAGGGNYELTLKVKNPGNVPVKIVSAQLFDDDGQWKNITLQKVQGGQLVNDLTVEPGSSTFKATLDSNTVKVGKKSSYKIQIVLDNDDTIISNIPIR